MIRSWSWPTTAILAVFLVGCGDGDGASRTLTVDVQPDMWFMLPDNNVMDLTQYNWGDTGQLLEFDVELEHGFIDIEIG